MLKVRLREWIVVAGNLRNLKWVLSVAQTYPDEQQGRNDSNAYLNHCSFYSGEFQSADVVLKHPYPFRIGLPRKPIDRKSIDSIGKLNAAEHEPS